MDFISLSLSSPSHLVLYVLSAHRPIKACLGIEGERVEGREEMGGGEWGGKYKQMYSSRVGVRGLFLYSSPPMWRDKVGVGTWQHLKP